MSSLYFATMKKSILFPVLLMMTVFCYAQEEEEVFFPTDRPGYTWGTDVLPLHKISWENGFSIERDAEGNRTITMPSTIVRYGIFENVELRVSTDFPLHEEVGSLTKQMGISPLTFGTKIKCYDGDGLIPSIGVLAEFQSPHIGSTDFLPSHLAPSLYLIFENAINDWFYVCYNAGAEWDGETATPTTFLSLCLGFNILENLGAYAETFNYLHPEGNEYYTEFGFCLALSPRLQLDIEADFSLQQKKCTCIGGGVAWMLN